MGDVGAEFDACTKNLDESIKREMMRKGALATNTLRNVELEVLSKGGSGRKYKRLPNRSSAPGETPAPQSGHLRQDWNDETLIESRATLNMQSGWKVVQRRWQADLLLIRLKRKLDRRLKKSTDPILR